MQRRIAELEGQAKPGDPLRMPGLKAKSARKPPAQQGPRKSATPRDYRPPVHDIHPPGEARDGELSRLRRPPGRRLDPPHSGSHRAAGGGTATASPARHRPHPPGGARGWRKLRRPPVRRLDYRTREVIELPGSHRAHEARTCPACRRRCTPPAELDSVALGQQRLGVNLLSLIATLREEGRLPIRSVQWYLETVHQLRLSVGAIVSAIHRTAQRAQPAVAAILDRIRASPVVHADETGWRQSGSNGYVWTFSTPTERYFLRRTSGQNSRGRGVERCFLRSIGQRFLRCLPPL